MPKVEDRNTLGVITLANEYPYMVSNNRIGPILAKITTAAKPEKFTHQFLKHLGFTSSNDRAIIPLLKKLGFLDSDGTPTEYYDKLKDATQHPYILGERIRDLYNELFTINLNIYDASDDEIKGAMSRVTGAEAKMVNRYFATFKALASNAKFKHETTSSVPTTEERPPSKKNSRVDSVETSFHYNIQIHLPATTDISVYNAIFQSLRDNLDLQ